MCVFGAAIARRDMPGDETTHFSLPVFCELQRAGGGMTGPETVRVLLGRLEAAWRSMNAPIVERLAPGASEERLDEAERLLGFPLPSPLRQWWSWHNGLNASERGKSTMDVWVGARSWKYLSLGGAIEQTRLGRGVAEHVAGSNQDPALPGADQLWAPMWMAISHSSGGYMIAVDCTTSDAPVRHIDWEDPADYKEPHLASFEELLEAWICFLEQGIWRWEASRWVRDQLKWSALPRNVKPFA